MPSWANTPEAEFFSATRTPEELSLIVAESRAPKEAKCERGWRLFRVQGPLDFSLIGIIAGLSGTLADAGISIFAMSTYDTDYVMVKQADFDRALTALRQAGYLISQSKEKEKGASKGAPPSIDYSNQAISLPWPSGYWSG